MLKNNKGITLIVLVIIIVVAIMLVGTIIGQVTGNKKNSENESSNIENEQTANEAKQEQTLAKGEYIILGNAIEGVGTKTGNEANEDDWKIIYCDPQSQTKYAILADYLPNSTGVAQKAGLTSGANATYGVRGASQADLIARLMPDVLDTDSAEIKNTKSSVKDQAQKAWKSLLYEKLQNNNGIKVYGGIDKNTLDKITGGAYPTANSIANTDTHACYGYWLASAEPTNEGGVCLIDYTGYPGSDGSYNTNYGICPVAIISADVNVEKNSKGIWEVK